MKLAGQVAVVAGATRGAGRGIARMLGEQGCTVYCSGRSVRGKKVFKGENAFATAGRPETIDETAELVDKAGGKGIPVQTDHLDEEQVKALFARVHKEQGKLDILVNDIWGGDEFVTWGKKFWESDVGAGWQMVERAVRTHVITARHGIPLMLPAKRGLVVEITDGDHFYYRTSFFYDLCKMSVIRLAYNLAEELRDTGITSVAVTPGFLRSEAMLENFGVTAENWMDAAQKVPHFAHSETPALVGRGIAAIASDGKMARFHGKLVASWTLAREYGFTDEDGRTPDWWAYFSSTNEPEMVGFRTEMERTEKAYLGMRYPA